MIHLLRYCLLLLVCLICTTCKKKTSIHIKVFNPALNEYVANATVVLVERKENGLFSSNVSCKEIATATSDANGNCSFDKEKLKTNSSTVYYCAVKNSWGQDQFYSCSGKASGYLDVGKTNTVIVTDDAAKGYFQIRYNNLLNPSQPGDSLIASLNTIEYPNPKGGVVQGEGGIFGSFPFYGCNGYPFPATVLLNPKEIQGQRLKRTIRKRKMGVVTVNVDTIKVYPNQTTMVDINW